MRSCHTCATDAYFIVHLQVFGILSVVVMVIILYCRIHQTPPFVWVVFILRVETNFMGLLYFDEEMK